MSKHLDLDIINIDPNNIRQLTGSCLCGGVSYSIDGAVRDVVNCFCEQCRKTSGHFVAASKVNKANLRFLEDSTLDWYECLPNIFRGFCKTCGSSLFWEDKSSDSNEMSIMAGTLDGPTHLKTIGNIFVEDASDYCETPKIKSNED